MTETLILDEGAVSEIEAQLKRWDSHPGARGHFPASWNQVSALCATVRHLRAQVAQLTNDRQAWLTWADGLTGNQHYLASKMRLDLQSQLEQLRVENERLNEAAERDREHLNAKQSLLAGTQSRLAQVEQERGVLSEALRTIEHPNVGAEDAKALKKIARQTLEKL